ncbi:MAG: UbiA family prenyltransferase [Bryobacteraceae bacterium]
MAEQGKPVERDLLSRFAAVPLVRLVRVRQWAKNVLIFIPMLLSHKLADPAMWPPAVTAFFAFSFCASALYIWNDLLDIQGDRAHPRKRRRPIASGEVSVPAGMLTMLALLAASIALSASLPSATWALLLTYTGGSLCYSALLKSKAVIDVVCLSGFYTLRMFYGGAATGIAVSVWTMAFAVFLFLSLALIKRLTELRNTKARKLLARRAYRSEDLPILAAMAAAAGYLSALVLGLYIQSAEVQLLYAHPRYLWLMMPALVYWISRALLLANRGEMDDDPVLYALRDRASHAVAVCCAAAIYLAT